MFRFIWAQLRGRPRRTLALLAGVLVATTGFTVLSAGAAISQLRINDAVEANYRPAYDILVRPKGSRTGLEEERGLVRPNYLSGLFGGITKAQLDRVRAAGHVEIAAPIAMLGYSRVYLEQPVDLTDQLDPNARSQLFRLTPSWIADRGLTVLNDAPQYLYVSRDPVYRNAGRGRYEDGSPVSAPFLSCVSVLQVRADGSKAELCLAPGSPDGADGTTTQERTLLWVKAIGPDGRFSDVHEAMEPAPSDRLVFKVSWDVMVLAAGIDPVAEAELVGLDSAVTSGLELSAADAPTMKTEEGERPGFTKKFLSVPALIARTPYVDEQVRVDVQKLGAESIGAVAGKPREQWVPALAAAPGAPSGTPGGTSASPSFGNEVQLAFMYQSGGTRYEVDQNGALHPKTTDLPAELWKVPIEGQGGRVVSYQPPIFALDHGFRPVTRVGAIGGDQPATERVGEYDPNRIRGFSPLSAVPLETYQAPEAVGADERTRQLLGGQPLRPNSNPAGYLATPPLVLTNLSVVDKLPASEAQRAAPISAIRVRVAGVTGFNDESRALVRSVAAEIARNTELDVDITIGSSPEPQTVVLPAGKGGRPELRLSEGWSRKGVAVRIVEAADRKSLVLFGLILLVCALFLGNAVAAAVRDRRRELAVLACLGWPASRLAAAILGEVGIVGLAAGTVAAGIAVPLSHLVDVSLSGWHALLALPVGIGIALLAGATPALRAARARPGSAVHPAVLGVRRVRRRRTVLTLALANLTRVPGRTALGVLALAIGIAALTVLVAIGVAFHNEVIGSLLGDAVALRVRLVDLLAALAAVLLGVLALADVLYINLRERSNELAALWASGWSDRALLRLVGYEGLAIGVLGAMIGATAGLLGTLWVVGVWNRSLIWLAGIVALAAVVITVIASLVPALLLRRLPLSALLAEE